MENKYDIFISYKRKSLPTANNLYYRLTTRGYSTFFDLEEMRRDNFNVQLLNYIENAKDVFVILEEGSLDGCKKGNWEEQDWFCREIAFAIEKKKNIIPILLGDYKMPTIDFFPEKLKELSLKHSPSFSFSFFDAFLDKLIEKKFITSEVHAQNKAISVFKFYSNENCQVFKEGKLVCSLDGLSEKPYYMPVYRKGDYRFKAINDTTSESRIIDAVIEADEEKKVEIKWDIYFKKNDQNIHKEHKERETTIGINTNDTSNSHKFSKIRLLSGIIIVLVGVLIIECVISLFVLDFDDSRQETLRTRVAYFSNGLINRVTLLIPTQLTLISSVIFYFSHKYKTIGMWLKNLATTTLYVCVSVFLIRFFSWLTISFFYEVIISVVLTCIFYLIWSLLFKHVSTTARFIPF